MYLCAILIALTIIFGVPYLGTKIVSDGSTNYLQELRLFSVFLSKFVAICGGAYLAVKVIS